MYTYLPRPLLYAVGFGIFASTTASVRLTWTENLRSTRGLLYNAMPVAAWTHTEHGLRVMPANLPAVHPFLEKLFSLHSTLRSSGKRGYRDPKIGDSYLYSETEAVTEARKAL